MTTEDVGRINPEVVPKRERDRRKNASNIKRFFS